MSSSLSTPGDYPKFQPSKEPALTDSEVVDAVAELNVSDFTKKFPVRDRNYADPAIGLQTIGLVSFIPAKGATPNSKGIYGFAKLRGNYSTEDEANQRAEMLIKDVDSTHIIYHAYVGRPFPLTNSKSYAAETSEVDIRKDTTESVSAAIKGQKKEDQKLAEEIKSREHELMEDVSGNRPQADIDLDEYITLNVKKAQLSWTYLEHVNKIKELKNLIIKTRRELEGADVEHPTFKDNFYQKYTGARTKSGLTNDLTEDQKQGGFMRYLVNDVPLPGIDLSDDMMDNLVEMDAVDTKKVRVLELKSSTEKPKKVYEDEM